VFIEYEFDLGKNQNKF